MQVEVDSKVLEFLLKYAPHFKDLNVKDKPLYLEAMAALYMAEVNPEESLQPSQLYSGTSKVMFEPYQPMSMGVSMTEDINKMLFKNAGPIFEHSMDNIQTYLPNTPTDVFYHNNKKLVVWVELFDTSNMPYHELAVKMIMMLPVSPPSKPQAQKLWADRYGNEGNKVRVMSNYKRAVDTYKSMEAQLVGSGISMNIIPKGDVIV